MWDVETGLTGDVTYAWRLDTPKIQLFYTELHPPTIAHGTWVVLMGLL